MGVQQTLSGERSATGGQRRSWARAVFLSPFLWGGLLCVGFYALIPVLPVQRGMATRYFCSHPLEYVTTVLFFVGMATLALKAVGLLGERAALEHDLLDDGRRLEAIQPLQRVELIEKRLDTLPSRLRNTYLARRIDDVCGYVSGRRSSRGLEEHLKYLAELATDSLHESYALIRTITWAVPILGFLGTVIGITIAIANVTPEQLDTSLGEVTGGLAVAFDTTALALALSLVMVFSSFLVQRSEQRILTRVEEFGIERIACLFPTRQEPHGPLAAAEEQAARQLIEQTESLINRQTQLWHEGLEALRNRWTETLDVQKRDFDKALQEGMSATLGDHAKQLEQLRADFLGALQTAVGQVHQSTQIGIAQVAQLQKQTESLLNIVSQEEQLARLQERLSQNLEAVRAAETFEETLHSLSAAVHLLTARARPKAA